MILCTLIRYEPVLNNKLTHTHKGKEVRETYIHGGNNKYNAALPRVQGKQFQIKSIDIVYEYK